MSVQNRRQPQKISTRIVSSTLLCAAFAACSASSDGGSTGTFMDGGGSSSTDSGDSIDSAPASDVASALDTGASHDAGGAADTESSTDGGTGPTPDAASTPDASTPDAAIGPPDTGSTSDGGPSQPVFSCSSFASTGPCAVAAGGPSGGANFSLINGGQPGSLVGSRVLLLPSGANHLVEALNWMQQVTVHAFTASFTFVPNGQNVSLVLNNSNDNPGFNGAFFESGAGCEAGFFQGYSQTNPPNNVFALELDSYSSLTNSQPFTYSSAQIYTSNPYVQCPCIGGNTVCGTNNSDGNSQITKLSTSPVPLNSPANAQNTSTGHTYSATVTYDGSNFTLNLYDVTAGGSCPGPNCYSKTWTNVDIPASVAGNTAWVGLVGATGSIASSYPLYVNSFVYTEH